jgi:hypothetical protein
LKLEELTVVAPGPIRPAPIVSIDRPAWLDGDVDMPWLARPPVPLVAQVERPRFSAGRAIADLHRRLSLREVGLWPLIAGSLAVVSVLLLVLVVAAIVWQRLHV